MYERLTNFKDIYEAYKRARKGKRKKNEVVKYEANLSAYLWNLQQRLEHECFHIGGYHSFTVYEPKEREIQALSFADRVFQRILCDKILEPYFEPRLIYNNAACRKNKGTHFAMARFRKCLTEHYKRYGTQGYILKFDIRKYFDSIDHERLKEKLSNFPDLKVKALVYDIIDSYRRDEGKGVPIGNQSSQWFALYYLDRLDRFIKEQLRIKHYVRYMDDGVMVHHDKEFLKSALRQMRELVAEEKLEFNEKTQIHPISQGVDFLGFHYYLTDSGKVIKRLRSSAKKRLKRRLRNLKRLYRDGKIDKQRIKMSLDSCLAHIDHGHTWKLKEQILSDAVFSHALNREEQLEIEQEMLQTRDPSPLGPPEFSDTYMPKDSDEKTEPRKSDSAYTADTNAENANVANAIDHR